MLNKAYRLAAPLRSARAKHLVKRPAEWRDPDARRHTLRARGRAVLLRICPKCDLAAIHSRTCQYFTGQAVGPDRVAFVPMQPQEEGVPA